MAKCILLLAALLFTAVSLSKSQDTRDVKVMQQQLSNTCDEALAVIDSSSQRGLIINTNEFIHKLEAVTYDLLKAIINNDEKGNSPALSEIAMKLSSIAYELRQDMISQPSQLKITLRKNIRKFADETAKLFEVVQNNKESNYLKDIFKKLYGSLGELKKQQEVDEKPESDGKVDEGCKPWVRNITKAFQMITTYSERIEHLLIQESYEVTDLIDHVLLHFDREKYKFYGKVKTTVDSVYYQLKTHGDSLKKVIESHSNSNIKDRVTQIKDELLAAVKSGSVQISILCDLSKAIDLSQPGNQDFYNVMQKVGSDCLSSTKGMLWRLQQMADHNEF